MVKSIRRLHPDWVIWAVLTDREPEGFIWDYVADGFDKVISFEDLIEVDAAQWLFCHNMLEACAAIKGRALQRILEESNCRQVVYFDPSVALFNPITPVFEMLDRYSIILTPNQTEPESRSNYVIIKHELDSLMCGVFNLGFFAISNDDEGRLFSRWWSDRLYNSFYYWNNPTFFIEQQLCNLIPCYFEKVKILRNPGYNVTLSNNNSRFLSFDESGNALAKGELLRIFHFTKLGDIRDAPNAQFLTDNIAIHEFLLWYHRRIEEEKDERIPAGWWHYRTFDNGIEIPEKARELYRRDQFIRQTFTDPFKERSGYFNWLVQNRFII